MASRIEVIRKSVLAKNDRAADENREVLRRRGACMMNLLGGAGCGKTSLLERLLPRLAKDLRVGVLEGDLATTRDAERIAAVGAPVVQLLTEGGCHLTAALVRGGLERLPVDELDLIVVENVGNCVCPTNFDLGEHARLSMLSAAEGDDKPAKYAHLFQTADAVVISKMDLAEAARFNVDRAAQDIRVVNPHAPIFRTSFTLASSFEGLETWLRGCIAAARRPPGDRGANRRVLDPLLA
ncbi:MAG: hydrogenase nickel incorporation protein HypB [Phycisphaerales bacterium]|nr:hydrogenase nickel incorporation protein HypB [Phycisphaerales bacterium]